MKKRVLCLDDGTCWNWYDKYQLTVLYEYGLKKTECPSADGHQTVDKSIIVKSMGVETSCSFMERRQ